MAVELKDFVKATLLDIVSAVKETQQEAPDGAIIAPTVTNIAQEDNFINWSANYGRSVVSYVEFDVAVSASSKSIRNNDKAVGIQVVESVFGFSNKDHKSQSDSTENTSRIKFSIPLVYPQKVPQLEQLMKNQ